MAGAIGCFEGGRCYLPNDNCAIVVGGDGGVLGACAVFDTMKYQNADFLTLPDGSRHGGSDCPAGAALAPGDILSWESNGDDQGCVGYSENSMYDNGCIPRGTCGVSYSRYGLGGGWVVCFV